LETASARQFWGSRYDREDYLFGEAPNAFLAGHDGPQLNPGLAMRLRPLIVPAILAFAFAFAAPAQAQQPNRY